MNTSKIIRGVAGGGRYTVTAPITQWDYGYIFVPEIEDLPATYRLDFSNDEHQGTALPVYCGAEGAEVPKQLIDTGKDIFVWYFFIGDGYGKSCYKWRIPNKLKPMTSEDEPTPSQHSTIDQAISALNTAVEKTSADVASADASATSAAESADSAAESAASAAESATNAEASKQAAAQSETNAASSASTASAAATSAGQSAASAATSADRAEQAAAQSGYLWFYIENGKLYMDRTANTQVDFFMRDGKLYVEEIA